MTNSRGLLAIGVALAVVLIVAGGAALAAARLGPAPIGQPVTAASSPEPEESPLTDETTPTAATFQRIAARLGAAGISATGGDVSSLAARYGVGGAVRILAFAHASGKTPAQIAALFDSGKGWGEIRRELDLSIGPGIGWIMGRGQAKED